jgi:hypothetical protein
VSFACPIITEHNHTLDTASSQAVCDETHLTHETVCCVASSSVCLHICLPTGSLALKAANTFQ